MDKPRQVAAHGIDPDRYRSYLVRLWRESPDAPWRCHVNRVGTSLERRFAGLAELFEFLVADVIDRSDGVGENAKTSTAHRLVIGEESETSTLP